MLELAPQGSASPSAEVPADAPASQDAALLSPNDVTLSLITPAKRDMLWRDLVRRIKLGLTTAQIAAEMEVAHSTVLRWFSDPRFIVFARREDERIFKRLDEEIGDLSSKMKETAQHAFEELCDILATCSDPKVRAQVAQDLLDRAGHSPVKKSVRAQIDLSITPEGARALRDGFLESIEVEQKHAGNGHEHELGRDPVGVVSPPTSSADGNHNGS